MAASSLEYHEQIQFPMSYLYSVTTWFSDHCSSWSFLPARYQNINYVSMKVFNALGSLSIFTGVLLAYSGIKESNLSGRLNDLWGQIRGFLSTITGSLQALGGISYLGMSLATLGQWITASKSALVASGVLSTLGNSLAGAGALFGGLLILIELKHGIECKWKLQEKDGQNSYQMLREEVLDPQKGLLWRKTLTAQMLKDISDNIKPSDEILKDVHAHLNKRIIIHSLITFLSAVTFVLGVLSLVSTPIAPWMLGVASIVLGISWLALDSADLFETMSESQVSQGEKVILYLITLLTSGTVIVGTVLARQLQFALVSAFFGLILLLVQFLAIYNMKSE